MEEYDDEHASKIEVEGDIEQNITPPHDPALPTTTGVHKLESAASDPEAATKSTWSSVLVDLIIIPTLLVIIFPVGIICTYCFYGGPRFIEVILEGKDFSESTGGVYSKLIQSKSLSVIKIKGLTMTITCRVGGLVLLWLLISLYIPGLKTATFLGVIHWKWSLFALLISLAYPFVYMTAYTSCALFISEAIGLNHRAFYFIAGLFNSAVSLIYAIFIFLVWMCYFHQHQGLAKSYPDVDKYTTRTLALVMVGALLWVLKSVVLLRWKAKAIYSRFKGRILMAGFRLFLLNIFLDSVRVDILIPWMLKHSVGSSWELIDDPMPEPDHFKRTSSIIGGNFKRSNIQDRMMSSQYASLEQLKDVAEILTELAKEPLRDDDKQISDILDVYQRKIGPNKYVTEERIRELALKERDARLLLEELKEEYPSMEISEVPFQKWVVDAHKSCVTVGYVLIDALAMVKVLNMILTWCIIVVVTLLWLLVTELATTKVLVVIGSPFLALTFVFGDTCKTFFQGFIFAFINHPYDIGDRCIIDGVEVEVKRVSIMTTTCLKIGTKEKMLYPNSDLATKLIINLEDKQDPTDFIEVVLDSSTNMSDIYKLQEHIKSFIDSDHQHEFFEKSCRVVMKEMGDNIKIIIYFQHTMNIAQDVSQSQFHEKKETQRSKLFSEVKKFLDGLSVKVETS